MFYDKQDFRHSFILANKNLKLDNLKSFNGVDLFEYDLFYSDTMEVTVLDKDKVKLILLGYALDIRDATKSSLEILEDLYSTSKVIENLEFINGRFIVLKATKSDIYVYSDATQLLPMVFNKEAKVIASHDNLVAKILSDNNYNVTRRELEVHNEFDFTRYLEVQKFNPSMRLKTSDFSYRRIYPRIPIKTASVEDIFIKMKPYLDQMILWLSNNSQEKFLSLTAGIDSRVSAALTKSLSGKVEYFTYFMPDEYIPSSLAKSIYETDKKVAKEMKENLGWNHSIVDLSEIPMPKNELKYYQDFYNSKHGYRLDKYYREYKNYKKALHIKSTVYGLGKADFPETLDQRTNSFDYFIRSIHGLGKEFKGTYDVKKEAEQYFERNLIELGVTKGRYFYDLFHLESRMGNWHSNLTIETDPETEEFIFVNSRKIIDLLQMQKLDDRRNYGLYKAIINEYWPILLYFGINKKDNLYDDLFLTEHRGLDNHIIMSGRHVSVETESDGEIAIMPSTSQISFDDFYNVTIENDGIKQSKILLQSDYMKEEGRGNIHVLIRNNGSYDEYDILDLNKGMEISIGQQPVSISIIYNKEYSTLSWIRAGKLLIKQSDNNKQN